MKNDKKSTKKQKANWNIKPYLAVGLTAFIVIIASISVFFLIYRYHEVSILWGRIMVIMQPVIIGLVLAYLVTPIVNFEEKYLRKLAVRKLKNPKKSHGVIRAVSVAGALMFVVLVISILLKMVIPELYRSIEGMIETLPRQVNSFLKTMENYTKEDSQLAHYLEIALKQGTQYFEHWAQTQFLPQTKTLLTSLTTGVITAVKLLFNLVIGIIISIYVLMSKEVFVGQAKKLTYAILPAKQANAVVHTVHKSHQIFGGFISGKILDSLIIGILCFIILSLLQMPYTVLVSVIVGVTNVIPFFGPYLGAIPSAILIMLASPIQGIYFIIFILILQQVDGNIIGPKILGDSTGLTSFWVVFAILMGGGLFGIPGMIMGVPVFAVIYYIARNIISYILKKKQLPEGTEQYIDVKELDMVNRRFIYSRRGKQEERIKIAVFASHGGTDMQAIIDGCSQNRINAEVVAVISNNSDSVVLQRAEKANIPCYHLSLKNLKKEELLIEKMLEILEKHEVEMIFLAGYMKMLPVPVLEKYSNRVFNIHPALLPKYGGKGMYGINVHNAVIQNGEKETGVTIHRVNAEYDSGEIVAQTKVPVFEDDTPEVLAERVLQREHTFLIEVIQEIADGEIKLGNK